MKKRDESCSEEHHIITMELLRLKVAWTDLDKLSNKWSKSVSLSAAKLKLDSIQVKLRWSWGGSWAYWASSHHVTALDIDIDSLNRQSVCPKVDGMQTDSVVGSCLLTLMTVWTLLGISAGHQEYIWAKRNAKTGDLLHKVSDAYWEDSSMFERLYNSLVQKCCYYNFI